MIDEISIRNFKSIEDLKLPLGRVTVLIGENGSGKSNILEAVAVLGAAAGNKLLPEVLSPRGVRIPDSSKMVSVFDGMVNLGFTDLAFSVNGRISEWPVSFATPGKWLCPRKIKDTSFGDEILKKLKDGLISPHEANEIILQDIQSQFFPTGSESLPDFIIYSPENTSLRAFEQEGQVRPLGYKGEGLFQMLNQYFRPGEYFRPGNKERLAKLNDNLSLLGWFMDLKLPSDLFMGEARIEITDRFVGKTQMLDQHSANEGFLFLLFYFVLFLSPNTPKFFAIDNIDAALNPKLCAELMTRLVQLAKENDKQVILTTHSPAILDGLNLHDEDQKLYVVLRDEMGRTQIDRVPPPKAPPANLPPAPQSRLPMKLSHAFMRGLLGGLPKNF